MSNEETGKLVRVDSVATRGKKIEISFSNGEKVVCSPDSYSEFRLYVGKEINRLEFNKIKDYVRMESLYAYALGLIGVRMRSKKEVREKLIAKGADLETHRKIIFRLEKQGLLDDKEFAFAYCEESSHYKHLGKLAILAKLKDFGISEDILAKLSFSDKTELENALACLESLNVRYQRFPDRRKKQSCRLGLHRQGFEDHIIEEAMARGYQKPSDKEEGKSLDKAVEKAIAHYARKYKGYELYKRVLGSLAMKGYDYDDIRSKLEEKIDVHS